MFSLERDRLTYWQSCYSSFVQRFKEIFGRVDSYADVNLDGF